MSNINPKTEIYFIVGPTASGKTSLSIKLAKKIKQEIGKDCEIISADSRQIYKDLNLSTGKITEEEKENIPHHLIDIINPGVSFSAHEFENLAIQKIKEIQNKNKIPIICGGTGFYIDTILFEQNLPNVSKNENLREELKNKNNDELLKILEEYSPEIIKKYSQPEFKNNKNRLIRVIEIVKELGYLPEVKNKLRFKKFEIIYIKPSKEKLKENIEKRFEQRMNLGMVEEIKNAIEKYNLNEDKLKSLGFEFHLTYLFLNNQITLNMYKTLFLIQELQYTKRQKTWFNKYQKIKKTTIISI